MRGSWLSSSRNVFIRNTFLLRAVQVVERAAERHQHPHEAPLGKLVIVSGPTLVQIEDVGCGEILNRSGVLDRNLRIGSTLRGLLGCLRLWLRRGRRSGSGGRRRFSAASCEEEYDAGQERARASQVHMHGCLRGCTVCPSCDQISAAAASVLLLLEGENPLPIVLHAHDRPAALLGFLERELEASHRRDAIFELALGIVWSTSSIRRRPCPPAVHWSIC